MLLLIFKNDAVCLHVLTLFRNMDFILFYKHNVDDLKTRIADRQFVLSEANGHMWEEVKLVDDETVERYITELLLASSYNNPMPAHFSESF